MQDTTDIAGIGIGGDGPGTDVQDGAMGDNAGRLRPSGTRFLRHRHHGHSCGQVCVTAVTDIRHNCGHNRVTAVAMMTKCRLKTETGGLTPCFIISLKRGRAPQGLRCSSCRKGRGRTIACRCGKRCAGVSSRMSSGNSLPRRCDSLWTWGRMSRCRLRPS